ncbi:hypothetical protein BC829DRAFT_273966 [Chytridium lagenaria]|nr:hypothetical protein BC829DRAFT_273966 [Chytridium lagenaria]
MIGIRKLAATASALLIVMASSEVDARRKVVDATSTSAVVKGAPAGAVASSPSMVSASDTKAPIIAPIKDVPSKSIAKAKVAEPPIAGPLTVKPVAAVVEPQPVTPIAPPPPAKPAAAVVEPQPVTPVAPTLPVKPVAVAVEPQLVTPAAPPPPVKSEAAVVAKAPKPNAPAMASPSVVVSKVEVKVEAVKSGASPAASPSHSRKPKNKPVVIGETSRNGAEASPIQTTPIAEAAGYGASIPSNSPTPRPVKVKTKPIKMPNTPLTSVAADISTVSMTPSTSEAPSNVTPVMGILRLSSLRPGCVR